MSNFSNAMNNKIYTVTANGAKALATPDISNATSGRMSLFYKSVRDLTEESLEGFLQDSVNEDIIDTIILCFYIRDCRGGKGEKKLGLICFKWLLLHYPDEFKKVIQYLPEYGRWDDSLKLFPGVLVETINSYVQNDILTLFCDQLKTDKNLMENGKPISMCAKWAPSEGDSLDKKYNVVSKICTNLGINSRQYRKEYIVPLRAYLKIVETYMCSGRWDDIEYSKVPSNAMKILKKAFEKHSPELFNQWKENLKSCKEKVNAKQLTPYELIREIRIKKMADEVCESQWKVLEEEVLKLGHLSKSLVVVDTSSSMESPDYKPLDVAISLGLIISNCVKGDFKNHVITFNSTPEFVVLKEETIFNRYQELRRIPWGGSTNLQATFDMILEKARDSKLVQEDMPETVYIISDMQFNDIGGYNNKTNFEEIDAKYEKSNYKRPNIVFWNVAANTGDFPVSVDDDGTVMISGYSTSIMKSVLESKEFSPYSILRQTIDDKRYKILRESLEA